MTNWLIDDKVMLLDDGAIDINPPWVLVITFLASNYREVGGNHSVFVTVPTFTRFVDDLVSRTNLKADNLYKIMDIAGWDTPLALINSLKEQKGIYSNCGGGTFINISLEEMK